MRQLSAGRIVNAADERVACSQLAINLGLQTLSLDHVGCGMLGHLLVQRRAILVRATLALCPDAHADGARRLGALARPNHVGKVAQPHTLEHSK